MATAAAAAAAVAARSRRDVVAHFMGADAVRPYPAVPYEPVRSIDRRTFERFQRDGVLKPASGGWYLDVPAYHAETRRQRRVALIAIAILTITAAIALLATLLLGHG